MFRLKTLFNSTLLIALNCFSFLNADINFDSLRPKIYDCFMFFNELELLEVRLDELYDKVDKFVLVEAKDTFRGKPKPLFFYENKERFARFMDKIIYVCVEAHPEFGSPWDREHYQRNQIMRGLDGCKFNDIILMSDLDEILRSESIDKIVQILSTNKFPFIHCEMPLFYFYLNYRANAVWKGSCATTYNLLNQYNPQWFREKRSNPIYIMENTGWHFSYMGGEERVIYKLESYSHAEYDRPELKALGAVMNQLKKDEVQWVEIDSSYPKFIQQNLEHFKEIGFIYFDQK